MPNASRKVVVSNANGLHARPVMQFVEIANGFTSSVVVEKVGVEPITVDGKSVMEMITLEATHGTELLIQAEGADAEAAVAKLATLFDEKFGEDA
jgi:phosphocarrier protein HPr